MLSTDRSNEFKMAIGGSTMMTSGVIDWKRRMMEVSVFTNLLEGKLSLG
jgi:hypothetical protein